jgi:hypothetical protein
MGQVAMTVFSLQEAVERTGTSKVDIWRAIQAGTLLAKKTEEGGFAIDQVDLFAVFETKHTDQCLAEDAAASVKISESPETRRTPETSSTTDIAVAFAALGTQKGPLEPPAEAPASDELRQNRDEMPAVDLPERNPQPVEADAARAKVETMARHTALAGEHDSRWWRRFVGWIRRRRGREARKRLRERLWS